ncbi:DUF2268 domain-containing protein [Solibacillus sp. FSL H8-0538]|uniref:DUF2268 domain-containing protein n=1 Tax=Solibacillus sp. FSL H8-0538 TaxID=2921400 RepID=UPI0030F97720
MGVVRTDRWLYQINEQQDNLIEVLCEPLIGLFTSVPIEAIHYELIKNGLFNRHEVTYLQKNVKQLVRQNVWGIVENEFARLKTDWNGPNVPIYIFPITNGEIPKNGIAYKDAIFLFVSIRLDEGELKALFAHEYHHVCRLHYLNTLTSEITLLDSLMVEGLAEYAVEALYGEQRLSPWTKRYSVDKVKEIWQSHFLPALKLKGLNNHRPFLYGDERAGLPLWIGYCAGYRMVQSFQENCCVKEQSILLTMPAEDILACTSFQQSI